MYNTSDYKCSFCGKDKDKIKYLITGPGVAICNECIDLCNEIIKEKENQNKLSIEERLNKIENHLGLNW